MEETIGQHKESTFGSEELGWIGVGLGALEEGAANSTSLIQRNVPVVNDAGKVIGNWQITSKVGSQVVSYLRTGSKIGGFFTVGGSLAFDGIDLVNGDLSRQRFGYRTAFTAGGFVVGTVSTGGLGALVTAIGILGEKTYDVWTNEAMPAIRSALPTNGAFNRLR